jgi:hypothetical protein
MADQTAVEQLMAVHTLDFTQLALNRGDIEQAMGYERGGAVEPLGEYIDAALEHAAALIFPQAAWRRLSLDSSRHAEGSVAIEMLNLQVGTVIGGLLEGAREAVVFVCTVGAGISDESKQLVAQGDMLNGYIYDTIGSEAVERAMELFQQQIAAAVATEGLSISNRYSPGYCGWSVAEQHALFGLFAHAPCGITLSESALMHPTKSISGVIGVGAQLQRGPYGCALCTSVTCSRRRG